MATTRVGGLDYYFDDDHIDDAIDMNTVTDASYWDEVGECSTIDECSSSLSSFSALYNEDNLLEAQPDGAVGVQASARDSADVPQLQDNHGSCDEKRISNDVATRRLSGVSGIENLAKDRALPRGNDDDRTASIDLSVSDLETHCEVGSHGGATLPVAEAVLVVEQQTDAKKQPNSLLTSRVGDQEVSSTALPICCNRIARAGAVAILFIGLIVGCIAYFAKKVYFEGDASFLAPAAIRDHLANSSLQAAFTVLTTTSSPSLTPSTSPTIRPSKAPTFSPTVTLSMKPSLAPSIRPSTQPTLFPTSYPSLQPSSFPSLNPSLQPSPSPTLQPSIKPTTPSNNTQHSNELIIDGNYTHPTTSSMSSNTNTKLCWYVLGSSQSATNDEMDTLFSQLSIIKSNGGNDACTRFIVHIGNNFILNNVTNTTKGVIGNKTVVAVNGTSYLSSCQENTSVGIKNILQEESIYPVMLVPDTDFQDCSNPKISRSYWDKNLLGIESFWKTPSNYSNNDWLNTVYRQQAIPENWSFVLDNVLFIGLYIPGGNIGSATEWNARLRYDFAWISEQTSLYTKKGGVSAMVIFGHSYQKKRNSVFFNPFRRLVLGLAIPTLYVYGDATYFKAQKDAMNVTNLWMVGTSGGGQSSSIKLSFQPKVTSQPFTIEQAKQVYIK